MLLTAKFQKVKLPAEKGKIWGQEFDISPKQLEVALIQEMVRLLEQDKKRALPLVNSKASVGKMTPSSSQSTITSVSIASSHSSGGAVTEPQVSSEMNFSVKEVLPCQPSDKVASSIIDDGDGESPSRTGEYSSSSEIAPVHSYYSTIDADRIRETLKRRLEAPANKTSNGIEACIESELENGIELESTFSEKKQRKV